jgi:alkanesulfonate monooxygenase
VIFSAGQSEQGKELSAAHSDCVFAIEGTIERAKLLYADLKGRLARYGREPDDLKILSGVTICAAETDAEAHGLMRALDDLVPDAVAFDYLAKMTGMRVAGLPPDGPMPVPEEEHLGPTGIGKAIVAMAQSEGLTVRQTARRILPQMAGNMIVGSARHVADTMEAWYREKACDGFMIAAPVVPTGLERFARLVVPELRRRGLFRTAYEATTLRGNLGLKRPPHPAFG